MKRIILASAILLTGIPAYSVDWDEVGKAPEGAHKGQMLLGAFVTFGVPHGNIIDAEHNFIRRSTFTFTDNFITKEIMLLHLAFSYGLLFEYMPIDYFGIRFKARTSSMVQRTLFGTDYQNWTRKIYSDYSFFVGPSVHVTTRKQWDISLTPLIGYALGMHRATPIAARLIYGDYNNITYYQIPLETVLMYNYAGNRTQTVNNLAVGAELNIALYISGGLFISFGCDWTMNMLQFGKKFFLYNPMPLNFQKWFFPNKNSSYVHTVSFILSAGYAFSN
jgi:hypothetical protein